MHDWLSCSTMLDLIGWIAKQLTFRQIRNIATNVASEFTLTYGLFSIVVTSPSKYVGNFVHRSNVTTYMKFWASFPQI